MRDRDGVPEDYPGRIVGFPAGVTHVVHGVYGVQSADADEAAREVSRLATLMRFADGPLQVERATFPGPGGLHNEVLLTYWTSRESHARWWSDGRVAAWWEDRPRHGDVGTWREVLAPDKTRFQYAAGVDDAAGSAAVLPLVPCKTFGYWGAYRDRLPASAHDQFKSPLAAVPAARAVASRGQRLRVRVPDNLCCIREGQGWGNCDIDEKALWGAEMEPVLERWIEFLARDPHATGCLTIRDCREMTVEARSPNAGRSQLAFLLSLKHIEHAARTEPSHLAVRDSFIRLYTEPSFTPRMHVWVEVHIVKHDECVMEYVNCDPKTGLLPWFEACAF